MGRLGGLVNSDPLFLSPKCHQKSVISTFLEYFFWFFLESILLWLYTYIMPYDGGERMTIKQRIMDYLRTHPEGIDDDSLANVLGLKQRQQANSRCRELEKAGVVERRHVRGKIHNFWQGNPQTPLQQDSLCDERIVQSYSISEPWYWEGNVQAQVVNHLVSQKYLIRSVADTRSRQQGKDIVAERDGKKLWITAKGYPKGTERTKPSTQAGHWFKQAVFDVLEYRGESAGVELGIALPDFPRYSSLANRIAWLKPIVKFDYYWVQEDGTVVCE